MERTTGTKRAAETNQMAERPAKRFIDFNVTDVERALDDMHNGLLACLDQSSETNRDTRVDDEAASRFVEACLCLSDWKGNPIEALEKVGRELPEYLRVRFVQLYLDEFNKWGMIKALLDGKYMGDDVLKELKVAIHIIYEMLGERPGDCSDDDSTSGECEDALCYQYRDMFERVLEKYELVIPDTETSDEEEESD